MNKLRIKIFEVLLPLDKIYEEIINSLKSLYKISNNSQIFENSFLILTFDSKNYAFVIRGSNNISKNRIILSIVALDIKSLLKLLNLKNNMKLIENHLYDLIIDNASEKELNPFKLISINGLVKYKKKFLIAERNVLNQILQVLYEKFNYDEALVKFPFSIINTDGPWEFWFKIYNPYLKQIETNIKKNYKGSIKLYKYYDFAVQKEIFPRIIDLIIIENSNEVKNPINSEDLKDQKIESNETENKTKEDDKSSKWIGFIHAYKKTSPMRLIDVLKFTEQVIKFVSIFKKRKLNMATELKPFIIFLSLYGYEKRIGKYLREHLYHDYKRVIPIFIVPPINKEIWHNFDAHEHLSQEEEAAKKRAKKYISLYKKDAKIYTYIKHNIQDAKENYSEILDREKEAKKQFEFVDKWSKILNISKSSELLNNLVNKNKFEEEIYKNNTFSE